MKKILIVITLVVLLAGVIGACAQEAPAPAPAAPAPEQPKAEVIRLTYAGYNPQGVVPAMEMYMDELVRRSDGLLEIPLETRSYGGALLGATENMEGIGAGTADIGLISTGYTKKMTPLSFLANFPFATDRSGADSMAKDWMYERYEPFTKSFTDQNVVVLYHQLAGQCILLTKKVIESEDVALDELKGLKLRAVGSLPEIIDKLGMIPVALSTPEVPEAIQRGTLDGVTGWTFSMLKAVGVLPDTGTIFFPGFGQYGGTEMVMNKDVYDGLSDILKAVIYDTKWNYAHQISVQMEMEKEAETFAEAQRLGVTLIALSPEMKAKWKEIVDPPALMKELIAEAEADGWPAQDFVDRYWDIVASFGPYTTYVPVLGGS